MLNWNESVKGADGNLTGENSDALYHSSHNAMTFYRAVAKLFKLSGLCVTTAAAAACSLFPFHELTEEQPHLFRSEWGRKVSLNEFRSTVLMVNFWATWCRSCVADLAQLQALAETFRERELQIIAVLIDGSATDLSNFPQSDYPALFFVLDDNHAARGRFGVQSVPSTFLLGCDRESIPMLDPQSHDLSEKIEGMREWSSPAYAQWLRRMIESSRCQ